MTALQHFKFLVASLLILCLSCEGSIFDTGEPQFDIEKFKENVVNALSGQVPGFAFAINMNQQLYIKGSEGFINVEESIPFTFNSKMHVASVSKTITATALLKLLSDRPDVDVDSPIAAFLPGYWTEGEGIEKLTFRHLLTHTSGFYGSGGYGYFDDLKKLIKQGLDTTLLGGDVDYFNPNYSLFRILIPILAGDFTPNITPDDSLNLALSYIHYVNHEIFTPMGIGMSHCFKQSGNQLKYYSCKNTNSSSGSGDLTLRCGAYGWHLSVSDLAAFNAHLRYNDGILDPNTRQMMDDELLGWDNGHSSANGDHGTYLFHSGQWHFGGSDAAGLESCIMKFPNQKVEVAVIYNCVDHPNPQLASPRKFLRDAYDNAWK